MEHAGRIGFLIRKFYQKNQAIWQRFTPDSSITSVQASALTVLDYHGSLSLTQLGREAAMDPATTRGVVERLRARDMISIESDLADKRKVIVKLEEPGYKLLSKLKKVMPGISEETLAPLNPAEQIALEYLLAKVTRANTRQGQTVR